MGEKKKIEIPLEAQMQHMYPDYLSPEKSSKVTSYESGAKPFTRKG